MDYFCSLTIKLLIFVYMLPVTALLVLLALLILVLLVRFGTYGGRQPVGRAGAIPGLPEESFERISKALQFRTVSYDDEQERDEKQFDAYKDWLKNAYPNVHKSLYLEVVNDYGLLYHWQGRDENEPPVILLAHYDVVPASDHKLWKYPPFSGTRAEGFIWGRGALDDKASMIGILEAVEHLLQEGFNPGRSVYLAFGFDEEIGGRKGAAEIARILERRGVAPEFVLDEGMAVTKGIVPGVERQVALVGIAEKGSMNVELSVETEGGHASMPEGDTISIGILSRAVSKLMKAPFPVKFTFPVKMLFKQIAPYAGFFQRLALSNQWLFKPLISHGFQQSGSGNATIRTTVAPTLFHSGEKVNTLPRKAITNLNIRLLPGENEASVIQRLKRTMQDSRVQAEVKGPAVLPSPVASTYNNGYRVLYDTLKTVFPDAVVAPTLVIGATDSRNYKQLTGNIYRFSPIKVDPNALQMIHGVNERISESNFREVVQFYIHLIQRACRKE